MAPMNSSLLSSPNGASVRNIDKIFEDAQLKGILKLNARKLKEIPKIACKYDLSDIVKADLSKNRLSELPEEVCSCPLLEDLDCYNNVIRSIPEAVVRLQSLVYLNLSRNQLTVIPVALCHLPLQVCNLRNNRLVSVPEEISAMKFLKDLDVSCNEITILPPQLGSIASLRHLNLKRNLLLEIPAELCQLCLVFLDVSANRISALPTLLRFMTSLQNLVVDQNPLTFPPAVLCKRGRIHIFKFLEIQAIKEDKRGIVLETEFHKFRSPSILSETRLPNGFSGGSCCRKSYTFDSGYSTSDGDCRSQESQELNGGFRKYSAESPRWDAAGNLTIRNQNTNTLFGADEEPVQTFREYKEALKKRREAESHNVYKRSPADENGVDLFPKLQVSKTKTFVASRQPLHKSEPSVSSLEEESRSSSSPLVTSWSADPPSVDGTPKHACASANEKVTAGSEDPVVTLSPPSRDSPHAPPFSWPKNTLTVVKPSKSTFTMKRELDKAREEQELISQLREILESRLKLKLPSDLESALNDGVFLCHLANNIRANSVTCIHVPSPAVAELQSWAESFLESSQTKESLSLLSPPCALATPPRVIFSLLLLALFFGTSLFLYKFPSSD